MRKHFWLFVLCTVFLLFLAACGTQETGETVEADNNDYVYVPEFIEFGSGEENSYYGAMIFDGNSLYYNQPEYDEQAVSQSGNQLIEKLYEYSLEDGSRREVPMQIAAGRSISLFSRDNAGNIYAVLYDYSKEEVTEDGFLKPELFLNKYDSQGTVTLEKDITGLVRQYGEDYVSNMAVDEQGNLYLGLSDVVLLFNAEGEERGVIEVKTSWICDLETGKNGKVYLGYYDNNSNGEIVLSEIDFQRKEIGNTYKNLPGMSGNGLSVGITGDFLLNDGAKVYEYDLATQTYEELLAWADCNVLGANIQKIGVAADGTILAVLWDWTAGTPELVKLTAVAPSEIEEAQELVIATLYDDSSLQEAVVAFNKANDKYRVTIKTYISGNNWDSDTYDAALTRLQNDILSDTNCPDILNLAQIDEKPYIEKGVFEDMYPYIEKSNVLSKEDFFENILDGFTYDGKLLAIPAAFSISTIVGKTSVVGEKMGWTLDDMITCAKEHPEAVCFDKMEKGTVLNNCLLYNQDVFMDWEEGKCHFDTEEFKRILEFANEFPSEIDWQSYTGEPDVEDLQSERVLLTRAYIHRIPDIQIRAAQFDAEVTYIGFPTPDGSVGCELYASATYGIIAKSPNKEGAWAFLESYLTNSSDSHWTSSSGFPPLKSKFEQGAKSYQDSWGTTSVTMADGWSYTYHQPTEEEIDLIRELIAAGKMTRTLDDDISAILFEEAYAYFTGQKSLDEVADIIQNRAQIYMSEKSVN